jgi:sporulation protein YlmC with PRC-barrel domain
MAALLCLTLAQWAKAGDEADAPKASTPQENSTETKSKEGAPAKFNKASGILGMEVRNQNAEHLGHIKDLVIDWKAEGVSYAVISTAPKGLFGMGGKLLAVPLSALTVSPDQKNLILNADKSKVETAMGLDPRNWPSVSNPAWGAEPFWQKGTSTPAVTDQPAEPDATGKPEMKPETNPESKPDVKPDQDPEAKPDTGQEPNSDIPATPKPDKDPESPQDSSPDV